MKVTASAISLTVVDVEASRAFLVEHLGFREKMSADGFVDLVREDVGMDIIFLRNVLIYFEPQVQHDVVAKLCRHLRPGGLLILGHSDTTRSGRLPLRLIRGNIYERLED